MSRSCCGRSRSCCSTRGGRRETRRRRSEKDGGGRGMTGRAIRVGVIGCGYWGPNLARNFARHPGSQLQAVCDVRYERATRVGAEYRVPTITDRPEELLKAPDLDLVVIATPSFTHYDSIMDHLIGQAPVSVAATGAAHGGSPTENIAYLTVRFPGSLIGHVHVNWLAPAKVRRTIVGGSKRMMIYDDVEPSEKLKIYDKGFTVAQAPAPENEYELLISYRSGDMHAPQLDTREALAVEADNLVRAIGGKEPLVADGRAGWRVVRILEAAQKSIEHEGETVVMSPAARGA